MLEHIREQHGPSLEYIMITGDYPAHDVWLQSRQQNLDTAAAVLQPLAQYRSQRFHLGHAPRGREP